MAGKKSLTFGEKLKKARADKGITMKELALKACITERYVYYFEENAKMPSTATAVRLADALGVTLDYLLRD